MDLRVLILISLLLCLQVRAEGSSGSIFFLDSPVHRFFRTCSSDAIVERDSMLISEVGAAVLVLLGFAPPASLPAESSSKLNEILQPNPFDRPRAAIVLEVQATEDPQLLVDYLGNAKIGSVFRSKVLLGSSTADIQLPDEDEVSLVPLDEPLDCDYDAACMDKEIHDLASWLGGSYVTSALEPLNGELIVPLTSGSSFKLQMSKKTDKEFAVSLVSLIRNIRRGIEMHEDFSGSMHNPAELMTGCFTGIKALQEQYGPGIAHQGMELFLTTLAKVFDSLQAAYKGQIVGVIFFTGESYPEFGSMLNVKFTSRPSSRWLEELAGSTNLTTVAEVELVRWTLAWLTGIILLISTLLGVNCSSRNGAVPDYASQGQIVGVIFFTGESYPEFGSMLNVKFTSRPSSRWLEELAGSTNLTTVAEVELVRWTLAWLTGIILLISTLLGVYFLLNMPLTRDTLLYSNVKLD